MTLQVPSNVMDIATHEVAQAMGLEETTGEVDLHHVVDVASEETSGGEVLQDDPVGQQMEASPVGSGLDSIKHGPGSSQHGLVDDLLISRELAVDRVGAGDVAAVAAVLGAHVEEHHVSVPDGLVVGSPGVTVVQHCGGLARGGDTVVAHVSANIFIVIIKYLLQLLHTCLAPPWKYTWCRNVDSAWYSFMPEQ